VQQKLEGDSEFFLQLIEKPNCKAFSVGFFYPLENFCFSIAARRTQVFSLFEKLAQKLLKKIVYF
jgi:hypothetical protein